MTQAKIGSETKNDNFLSEVSLITKQDTFFVDEKTGEFVNYNKLNKYDPRYCQKLIDFFNIPPYAERLMKHKTGIIYLGRVANEMPLLSKFATELGVPQNRLLSWSEKYTEFAEAMNLARDYQEYILVTNSLLGLYTANIAIFSMKNLINWKNEPDLLVTGKVTIEGVISRISDKNAKVDLLSQAKEMVAIGTSVESK